MNTNRPFIPRSAWLPIVGIFVVLPAVVLVAIRFDPKPKPVVPFGPEGFYGQPATFDARLSGYLFDPNAPAKEMTTRWVGLLPVEGIISRQPSLARDTELGLRSDGVLVWREAEDKK